MSDTKKTTSYWTDEEVLCLLSIWSRQSIQDQLDGTVRNNLVIRKVADEMAAAGFERTIAQIKSKIKKLRESFRKAEDNNRTSGRGRVTCKFYKELSEVLGGRPETAPVAVITSVRLAPGTSQDSGASDDVPIEEVEVEEEEDSDSDEEDPGPVRTPPELVGDFVPDVFKQDTPKTTKGKGKTKRKKSKLQQSFEWMGNQMRQMDEDSAKRNEAEDAKRWKEQLEFEREMMREREELAEKRRKEDRDFQEKEREKERQHQLQMLQLLVRQQQPQPPPQSQPQNMGFGSFSWDPSRDGPSYSSL